MDKLQPLRTNWSSNLLFATSNPRALDRLQENLCSNWDLRAHTVQEVKKLKEQVWWSQGGVGGGWPPRQHRELTDRDNMCELPPCLARCTNLPKITKWLWLHFGRPNLVQIFLVANLNQKPKRNGYSRKCSSA